MADAGASDAALAAGEGVTHPAPRVEWAVIDPYLFLMVIHGL